MPTLYELTSPTDPRLPAWLELYERAFPPGERVLVGRVVAALQEIERGEGGGRHLLAVEGPEAPARLAALAYTYEPETIDAAFLWYLATDERLRGQGAGAALYRAILARLRPAVKALIFDVEAPHLQPDPDRAALARRRVGFYRRLGARVLGGIQYIQTVGDHQPPIELLLMAHPLGAVTAAEALDLARRVFPEAIRVTGVPHWAEDAGPAQPGL